MLKIAFYLINLLMLSLVVGTMFGIWLGYNPAKLSYATYVEQQQNVIRALNIKLPLFAAVGIVLTIISAILSRGNQNTLYFLIAAIFCLIIAGIVTRFFNQPINAKMMTWTIQSPPLNWMELRDNWWMWHIVRMIAGITGISCLFLGFLIKR
ncbi:MAG: hypothetical protein JWR03_2521 [Cohnella sp.]|jgi:uncharacterized membrane protein|nr:hypothetical protein [Cohnella sp.]